MTTPEYVVRCVIPAAATLLPESLDSTVAWAQVMAIGFQESEFRSRRQIAGKRRDKVEYGPARGFWQFEEGGGVAGVLQHPDSASPARAILRTLGYGDDPKVVHQVLEHHDVLACAFARLLLWTDTRRLPMEGETDRAWAIYLTTWNPGKPHPDKWAASFAAGWSAWPSGVARV